MVIFLYMEYLPKIENLPRKINLHNCLLNYYIAIGVTIVVLIVWQLDLQLPVQSMDIITNFVSLNPIHGEGYLIQHYVIKFVSDLRQVSGFILVLHDIAEILKVALNTINPNPIVILYYYNITYCHSDKFVLTNCGTVLL